ncbi:MAG: hypothetical protein LBG64_04345 [Pseudomonadales bacterium]|jgi:1-deoxy-D-xylulose-5-phosphate reductoisomerase|nr:hypothetical protein [Pseudomonadales bacterium]
MSKVEKKRLVILGSTGSIGRHALNIVDRFPDQLEVVALSCNSRSKLFEEQLEKYQPLAYAVASEDENGLERLASISGVDLVVVGVVGTAGIAPTVAALKKGTNVALATKEVMVIAGEAIMELAAEVGAKIIPIDSEHSAMFQSLLSGNVKELNKVYLTMGYGKIAQMKKQDIDLLTKEEVLKTNKWVMGQKITVDSASCVNKIFEAIEAAHLFSLNAEQIQIVVHPEYLCHSLVEFVDGSIIGEFGTANMDRYLQYALFYPKRMPAPKTDFISLLDQTLTFKTPDYERFPILNLISKIINSPHNLAAVFHGADRAVVEAFLADQIKFGDIEKIIAQALDDYQPSKTTTDDKIKQALEIESVGYELAQQIIEKNYV